MSFKYNSTLRVKVESCSNCGYKKPVFRRVQRQPLCADCARITDTQTAIEEEEKRIQVSDLGPLIKRADEIFSQWLRLKYADKNGRCRCYTCDRLMYWTAIQCGHYKRRGNILLRWSENNCRPQCPECNCEKGGMETEFAKRLNMESPGIVEILNHDANTVYKADRTEINGIIVEYTRKFKLLRHGT